MEVNDKSQKPYYLGHQIVSNWLSGDERGRKFLILKHLCDSLEFDTSINVRRFKMRFKMNYSTFSNAIKELTTYNLVINNLGKKVLNSAFIAVLKKRKSEIEEYYRSHFDNSMASPEEIMKLIKDLNEEQNENKINSQQ